MWLVIQLFAFLKFGRWSFDILRFNFPVFSSCCIFSIVFHFSHFCDVRKDMRELLCISLFPSAVIWVGWWDPFMLAWDTIITLQRHYAEIFLLTWRLKGPKRASDWSPAAKPIQLKIKIGLSLSSKNFDLKILLGKAFPYLSRKFQVF